MRFIGYVFFDLRDFEEVDVGQIVISEVGHNRDHHLETGQLFDTGYELGIRSLPSSEDWIQNSRGQFCEHGGRFLFDSFHGGRLRSSTA